MVISDLSFETVLPLIGAVFSFSFGAFVWWKSPRSNVHILFLAFCTAITYWLYGTFQMFLNRDVPEAAIFWDRFVYLGVVFVPSLMHHFSLAITGIRGQRKLLIANYALSVAFLFISRTPYFVDQLNVFPTLVHSRAQIGHHVFIALFFAAASTMFHNLATAYRATGDRRLRSTYALTAAAFLNILAIGGTAYLPAYGIDIGYPFSYFSGIIFVILLGIAVTKYGFIATKVVVAEMFVFLAGLILLANVLLIKDGGQRAFGALTLVAFLYFGAATVRAIRSEIAQREETQALAAKLKKANAELRQVDALKSEFISIASHELRTPISVVRGYLSLALEGAYGGVPEPLKEKLEQVFTMNERLVQLVNNMLNVSRIERRKIEYRLTSLDAAVVVRRVVEELSLKARQKGLRVVFVDPPAAPVMAYADEEKLHEVLTNLVDNAIKYSQRGEVEVCVDAGSRRKGITVSVTDRGIGMTADEARRLFRKYHRARDPKVARESGTGLGLYICAKFVRGMGGDIRIARTAPGQGTTVAFTLPAAPAARRER